MTSDDPATVAADRPFRRSILRGTVATAGSNVWAMVVGLVSLPLLLRGLGTDAFGTWVLLQTFSAISGWLSLADLGVGVATTRVVSAHAAVGDDAGAGRAIANGVMTATALGVLSGGVLALLGPWGLPRLFDTPPELVPALRTAVLLFAAQIVLDLATEGIEAALEGLQRVDLSRVVDASRRTAVAVATIVAALASHTLVAVAVASLAASSAGTVAAVLVLHARRPTGRADRAGMRDMLVAGRGVAVLRPLGVLHRTMDRVIVGAVLGPASVAVVEVATQVQTGAEAVLSASSYAVVPSASWLRAREDTDALRALLLTGTRYATAATLVVSAAAAALAAPAIHLWLGGRLPDAPGLTLVALAYVGLTAPIQVGSNLLLGVGRTGAIVQAAVAALVVNGAASVVLVHHVGIVGCFVGSLLGGLLLVPLLARSILRDTGTSAGELVRSALLPALPPAAAMAGVALLAVALPLGDFATVLLGGAAGAVAALAVAIRVVLAPAERDTVQRVLGRRGRAGPDRP